MPRYFISTYDGFRADDTEGVDLPNDEALATLLRQTLAEILRHEGGKKGQDDFWADAIDESGNRVMAAKIRLTIVKL